MTQRMPKPGAVGATSPLALAILFAQVPAAAQAPSPADPRGVVAFITENDSYSPAQTDRWYTNGIRLGWQSAEGNLPSPVAWLDGRLAELFGPARSRWGLAVGQNMYTPVNTLATVPDPRDRPYAGYLYAELGLDRRTEERLDRFALQIGLIGPGALGRQAQDLVHEILGDRRARGWDRQLKDEPVLNLFWDRTWRVPAFDMPAAGLAVDVLPNTALALGNAQIHAGLGGRVRLGQGLAADFGPPRIRPALGTAPAPVGDGFGWYLFAGAGARVVGRDITLDGNTWRESASVDHRPFVGDLELGAAAFWRGVRLSYTHVWRSKEFVAQPKPFQFGSIALSVAF
jgi:lipid A 3-O-deacylase